MIESNERVEQFKSEIAEMRLKDPATSRDSQLLNLGVALMGLGLAVAVVAFFLSHNSSNALDQRDDIIIALAGVSGTVIGAALFVRYSVAQFLRFWLARLIYEQRAQTDRLLGTATGADPGRNSIADGEAGEKEPSAPSAHP